VKDHLVEEAEPPRKVSFKPGLRLVRSGPPVTVDCEIEKFIALQHYLDATMTVRSVDAQIGRMVRAGVITDRSRWSRGNPWDTAQKALARLRDPAQLARYWRGVCFFQGRSLGSQRTEALLAASWAILDVTRELFAEGSI
jgi:hypothetical protein